MKAQAYRQTFGFTAHGSEARLSTKKRWDCFSKNCDDIFLFIFLFFYSFIYSPIMGENVDRVIEKIYVDLWWDPFIESTALVCTMIPR